MSLSFSAPCALLKCDFYAKCEAQLDGSLECACPKQCPLSFDPVCGSDVKSYPNECTLQVESCRTKTRITVAKRGQCGAYSFHIRGRAFIHPEQSLSHPGPDFLYPETSSRSSGNEFVHIREQSLVHPGTISCPSGKELLPIIISPYPTFSSFSCSLKQL